MKQVIIRLIQLILLVVIAVSAYQIYTYVSDVRQFVEQKNEADQQHQKAMTEDSSRASQQVDSPYVIGWISIPGTDISYPLVQGEDNAFFLDHDYKGAAHPFGAVFLDAGNHKDFSDQNTVIYGHNVAAGYVFHDLENYLTSGFINDKNDKIDIETGQDKRVYRIVAAYIASPYEDYRAPAYTGAAWEAFRARVADKNQLTGPGRQLPDKPVPLVTLSTCDNHDNRIAIHAVLT